VVTPRRASSPPTASLVELFPKCIGARAGRRCCSSACRPPLPYFFTGLRIAATLAPHRRALWGDYTAGSSAGDGGGLGFRAIIYSSTAKYPALFATAAVTCALGFVLVAGVLALSGARSAAGTTPTAQGRVNFPAGKLVRSVVRPPGGGVLPALNKFCLRPHTALHGGSDTCGRNPTPMKQKTSSLGALTDSGRRRFRRARPET